MDLFRSGTLSEGVLFLRANDPYGDIRPGCPQPACGKLFCGECRRGGRPETASFTGLQRKTDRDSAFLRTFPGRAIWTFGLEDVPPMEFLGLVSPDNKE